MKGNTMHFRDINGFKRNDKFISSRIHRGTKVKPQKESEITQKVFIDAGIEHIHVKTFKSSPGANSETSIDDIIIPNNDDIGKLFRESALKGLFKSKEKGWKNDSPAIYITGKLSEITKKVLQQGESIMPAAVLWSAAKSLLPGEENKELESIGIIDLSASGYMVICIDKNGNLKDDLLVVNPRCGAGIGVNLNRILEKLDIDRENVDRILEDYLGQEGKLKRGQVPVRSDRCGVFGSSATVSDKNQGIPLDYALAVTMKSEVMKPCKKMPENTHKVYLTGGVFRWQYARDCAADLLKANGVKDVVYDEDQSIMMTGMKYLVDRVGEGNFRKQNIVKLRKSTSLTQLPSFKTLKETYEKESLYKRLPDPEVPTVSPEIFTNLPVNVGLDIGSTMAKIVITDARTGGLLFHNSYNNHGDTIETIKHIFRKLKAKNIQRLKIQNIGITGSGRYQVQKALKSIYPHLQERISVMVENYAHARGSISFAREHIAKLKQQGFEVNEDFCLLIDIGGEDTKISIISLQEGELFDNAMNIKCSAGTGSLMDTLNALFNIGDIAGAYGKAFAAPKAYAVNATCAVFLMENARKMQAEGYDKDEILASCCYAIVENMARSLWDQVEFPANTVALLHGQTMLSDPLPLAVTHRVQEYTDSKTFCLVPPLPGHRACIGLVTSFANSDLPGIEEYCRLDDLLERQFDRKIIVCRGAACGDKHSRCARTKLESSDIHGKISLTLGGCTAVNELQARKLKGETLKIPNAYKKIREFIDSRLPKSKDKKRLVIPRAFALSERAFFFGKLCEQLGIPVHIDNVQERDILEGQPLFTIDACAPNIGTTGQFLRLAREDHGIILVPQIDFLPIEGASVGRTCTTNQGGLLVALQFAQMKYPGARFLSFDISLENPDPEDIADQLYPSFQKVFQYYELKISRSQFTQAVIDASKKYEGLKSQTAEIAADFIEEAINKKLNISIVSAREYILNPGIYDSHIGKLLNDKGVVAIPTYVFDTNPDEQFDYIYWKNPHDLMTKAYAIAHRRFHQIIKHPRLKKLIKSIETGNTGSLMSMVTVSTFRCGPDSITLPVLAEITKNIPSLLIQSDAMIAELAHLENRVNTHLNQLTRRLHQQLSGEKQANFSIKLMDEFLLDDLYKKTDVLYFPTLNDNRAVTSVFRGAGFTVVDNFDDDTYDVEAKAKIGKKYVGDSACVPLAVVFSDMLQAVEDFIKRKKTNDPLVKGKERVVLFMHYGDGPCRQGQYIDICKFNLFRTFRNTVKSAANTNPPDRHFPIKFLANIATEVNEQRDLLSDIEKWTAVQGIHAIVLKGVLQTIYLKGGSNCRNFEEYKEFNRDYRKLKQDIYQHLEKNIEPGRAARFIVDKVEQIIPGCSGIARYFGYGLFNSNGLRKILKPFRKKHNQKFNQKFLQGGLNQWVSESVGQWVSGSVGQKVRKVEGEKLRSSKRRLKASKHSLNTNSNALYGFRQPEALSSDSIQSKKPSGGPKGLIGPPCHGAPGRRQLKIYVEGEVYLRIALVEEIFKFLVDTLGFGSFELNYSPLWAYLEYILEARIPLAERDISLYEDKLKHTDEIHEKARLMNLIKKKKRLIKDTTKTLQNFRNVLAAPLYDAAGIEMPHQIKKLFSTAKPVVPTFKPTGELVPFVGETITQLNDGTDLVLNVAPEGCMVALMGEMLSPKIRELVSNKNARIQHLFTTEGEINEELLRLSLLKLLGPEKFYQGGRFLKKLPPLDPPAKTFD
jgi:activator of 2-hydroxyglutaryl-CoA dehydratase/predicted nucleotide-binding protein (sugar kinase/HSP70/actin superfamily)